MANFNGEGDVKKYIEAEMVHLGNDMDSDRIVEFEFPWLADEDDIEFIFGGCHCTDAWYDKNDKKIRGNISIAKSSYDRNTGALSQHVFVYLNDGKPYFSTDERKRRISNPEKGWMRIALNGTVKI